MQELGKNVLENVSIDTNEVTGRISVSERKILQLAIPFSTGWKAYVDGKEQELYKSNVMYMALIMEPGEHDIELRYTTPLLLQGAILSVLTLLSCIAGFVIHLLNPTDSR